MGAINRASFAFDEKRNDDLKSQESVHGGETPGMWTASMADRVGKTAIVAVDQLNETIITPVTDSNSSMTIGVRY
jgi:hypothetical protein